VHSIKRASVIATLRIAALQRPSLKLSRAFAPQKFLLNLVPSASAARRALLSSRGCGSILQSDPNRRPTSSSLGAFNQ
jgi:hypothetical protein